MKSRKLLNLVGPQIRKLRSNREWSQAKLAIQLQLKGFDIGREGIAQMEGQIRCIKDKELPYIARALNVGLLDLFPPLEKEKPVNGHAVKTFDAPRIVA